MSKSTPGEWRAVNTNAGWRVVTDAHPGYFIHIEYVRGGQDVAADAVLASAAPDLLRVLRAVARDAGTNIMGRPLCPLHGAGCDLGGRTDGGKSCELYAAIAKAEGR